MTANIVDTKQKIWSLPYCLVLFTVFTANITMTMLMPILPIYITAMGKDSVLSGIAVGLFTFAALFCRPLFGWLLDTHSKKVVLLIGCIVIAISCFSYSFAGFITILLILRVIHGIGYSASTNATSTVIAHLVPPSRRSEGIGYYGAVFAASLAIGPAISMTIFHAANINAVFYTAFGIAAAGCIAGFVMSNVGNIGTPIKKPIENAGARKASIIEKSALPVCSVMIPIAFAYIAIMSFLSSYGMSIGMGSMSSFFLCYAAALIVSRVFVGKYTDKHGMLGILLPGLICMAITFVLLGLATNIAMFIIAAVFFGVGYGIIQPTLNSIVISGCSVQRRGAANATFFGSMDLGFGVGAVFWGIVSGSFGYSAMYLSCIAIIVIAFICYFVFLRKKQSAVTAVDAETSVNIVPANNAANPVDDSNSGSDIQTSNDDAPSNEAIDSENELARSNHRDDTESDNAESCDDTGADKNE